MTAPAPSSRSAAIQGSGEKPVDGSIGVDGMGTEVVTAAAAAVAAVSAAWSGACRRVGRRAIGSSAASCPGGLGRTSAAAERVGAERTGSATGWTASRLTACLTVGGADAAAGSWARLVTVPSRLKFDSSRGPIFSVGAGAAGGSAAVELSCAASGDAPSSKAATRLERQTKPLYLLAKIRIPSRSLRHLARFACRFKACGG